MSPSFLFIHGLGSSKNSRKFLALQSFFKETFDFYCMEWDEHTNIPKQIEQTHQAFKTTYSLVVFGDSTGANFAYQFRAFREAFGLQTTLIVSAPLLDLKLRMANFDFPASLIPYLIRIQHPEKMLMICPIFDELMNHSVWKTNESTELAVLHVEDTHRMPNFTNYLPAIKAYIEKS